MRWRKLGLIYKPNGEKTWARTHASVPITDHIFGDRFRIYFTARDSNNRSHVGWYETDITAPDIV